MLIDWFTVAAQIINFLLLVWLLKKFLYDRILRAVDEREGRIAAQLSEAAAREKESGELRVEYEAKVRDFEQMRETMLAQAKAEAAKREGEMFEEARKRIRSLEEEWREDLGREREAFLLELRRQAALEVVSIARRVISDLASADIQQCAVRVFLEKIRYLRDDACKSFASGDLSIRSAFDVPEPMRAAIQQALEGRLERPVRLSFEEAPDIGLGLELRGNGWRVGWSSETYLESMEEDLKRALEETSSVAENVTA